MVDILRRSDNPSEGTSQRVVRSRRDAVTRSGCPRPTLARTSTPMRQRDRRFAALRATTIAWSTLHGPRARRQHSDNGDVPRYPLHKCTTTTTRSNLSARRALLLRQPPRTDRYDRQAHRRPRRLVARSHPDPTRHRQGLTEPLAHRGSLSPRACAHAPWRASVPRCMYYLYIRFIRP